MFKRISMAIVAAACLAAPRAHLRTLSMALLMALSCLATAEEDNSLLLVANPDLESPVFGNSVVLVTPHGNGAAVGIIINHPLLVDSQRVFPDDQLLRDAGKIRYGGPVNPGSLTFLFRAQDAPVNALHLFDNVYISNDRELLAEQVERPRQESQLRVYLGYAGWAPGQLQAEIGQGDWRVVKVSLEHLFQADSELIWQQLSDGQIDSWI